MNQIGAKDVMCCLFKSRWLSVELCIWYKSSFDGVAAWCRAS